MIRTVDPCSLHALQGLGRRRFSVRTANDSAPGPPADFVRNARSARAACTSAAQAEVERTFGIGPTAFAELAPRGDGEENIWAPGSRSTLKCGLG
jgi:hypothetical protein